MFDIDVRTLFIFSTAANLFIIILFFTYVRLYKVKKPILYIFILARALGIIFLLILSLRDGTPEPMGIMVNTTINLFIIFYEVYCISFIERKFDSKHFVKHIFIPIFFSFVLLFFSTSSISMRVAATSLCVSIIYALAAYILLTSKGKTKIQYLTGYIFSLISMSLIFRSLGAFYEDKTTIYSENYILVLPLVFFLIINSILPLLLIFILKEKDNQKLQELNNSKDKFFSIIAHDLKGPLGGLQKIGELLWLSKSDISNEKRDILTKALYQNSKNTFNLLDNLLKWANTNSGLMVYEPLPINLREIILNNVNLFESLAKEKNISLSSKINDDLIVIADYNMIDTVIRNLISNAIKFTEENEKIEIILEKIDKTNNTCTIVIVDNGVGIDENFQSKIFELNSFISTFGTNNETGTGLGLKLCKGFLTTNKGEIWIESILNEGTSVFISLPLDEKSL